ncbi:MAG: M16 family metallopeptidase [Candidatus Kapaibacterium sp.]
MTRRPHGTKHVSTGVRGTEKSVLPNGVCVLTEHVTDARSFALGIWVNAGTRDEELSKAGIAHMIEHLVFRRSASRTSRQIASAFEARGAYVNAFTSKEQTCYYVRALTPHFEACLKVLADIVLHPVFDARDVEKERRVILEELKSYDDEPEELIQDVAEQRLFGSHPMGSPITGHPHTVAAIRIPDLRRFHRAWYRMDNITVAVAGGMAHQDIVRMVQSVFPQRASASGASLARRPKRSLPKPRHPLSHALERPFQQTHLCYARRTEGVRHKDRWALTLLNTVLGDGMSSRLHQRIREKLGGAYSVNSSLQLLTDCGVMSVYAGVERTSAERIDQAVRKELDVLASAGVAKSELKRAKEQVKSGMMMSLESLSARMNALAKAELEEGMFEDVNDTLEAIDAVSLHDVARVATGLGRASSWTRVCISGTEDASRSNDDDHE